MIQVKRLAMGYVLCSSVKRESAKLYFFTLEYWEPSYVFVKCITGFL